MTWGVSLVEKTDITNLLIYLISAMFALNLIPQNFHSKYHTQVFLYTLSRKLSTC